MGQTPRSQPVTVTLVSEGWTSSQERCKSLCHVSEKPLDKQILGESMEVSDWAQSANVVTTDGQQPAGSRSSGLERTNAYTQFELCRDIQLVALSQTLLIKRLSAGATFSLSFLVDFLVSHSVFWFGMLDIHVIFWHLENQSEQIIKCL